MAIEHFSTERKAWPGHHVGGQRRRLARATAVHVLPAAAGPLVRHAMLRLPGTALALASLGFLGLGPQPPSPEWGRLLADGMPYVERAPWVVAAPAGMLVLVAVLAVSLASAGRTTTRRGRPGE